LPECAAAHYCDPAHAFAIQEKFVADMMASVSPEARRKLAGLSPPI
jgi:hypothetical protein